MDKKAIFYIGGAVLAVYVLNNFEPTRRLLGGNVSVAEAVTANFWAGRRNN